MPATAALLEMSAILLFGAGACCVLYTVYEVGRLVQGARDGASSAAFAYDIETGERIPLFVERRRGKRRRN